MADIIFSFIIPHFNCPGLLARCINSIPLRDDIEIIVVDDNSDPNVIGVDAFSCCERADVSVIFSKMNGGGGASRNIGIEHASGKWLIFADADDYFTNNLSSFLDVYSDSEADIVFLSSQSVDNDLRPYPSLRFANYIDRYLSHKVFSEKVLRYAMYTPWSRMVKRSLVIEHNIRFEEIKTGNDAMFCLKCSKFAEKVTATSSVIYNYYRPIEGSYCSNNRYNYDNICSRLELGLRMKSLYKSVGYHFRRSIYDTVFTVKDKAYVRLYLKEAKELGYSSIQELFQFVVFYAARFLGIV